MSDPGSVPDPQDIQIVLRAIELHEHDETFGSEVVVAETGLEQSVVDTALMHLWQEDRIECRHVGWTDLDPILIRIRRVIPGRDRLWGEHGRYNDQRAFGDPAAFKIPQVFDPSAMSPDELLRSIPGGHEYMAAESDRRQTEPPTVELSPEFGVEIPLWPQDGETHALIPAALLERLITWQRSFRANFNPHSGWTSLTINTQWAEEALELEADLRAAFEGRFRVEVDLWPLNPGFVRTSLLNRPPML